MLKSIPEYISWPVITSGLFLINHMDKYSQLAFVSVVLQSLNDLGLGYVFVFDAQSRLYSSAHLLAHEVELLDHWHQLD